jgi:hypothetical protein
MKVAGDKLAGPVETILRRTGPWLGAEQLKFPAGPLAILRRDRLDIFWPAPGLIEEEGNSADRPVILLQASVTLE